MAGGRERAAEAAPRRLEAIGDRWTMLVIRDAFGGVSRLKRAYQERPERFEYRLAEKGLAS